MDVKCPKCQTNNPDTVKFCGECGTPLPSTQGIKFTETLEAPKQELTRGATFAGRYEIIEELGKGGMGRVYRVEDTKLRQEVALKLIRPDVSSDKKTIERFRNELRTARTIRHKNVCGMYDLGEEGGTHYLTMEYIRGEDLKSLIRKMGKLSPGQLITIAGQICDGLAEAHGLGVIHRDLKPQNVMIDMEGNARIMDFGIARSLESKGITGPGIMIGTPEYMSPEQVEGKEVDQRSDIYSLGVMLYEMSTGQVPFEGDTAFVIGMKHKSEMPKDPREINSQIPTDLSQFILRCLEKDKEKRYQGARELRMDLASMDKGIPASEKIVAKRKPHTSKEITVIFGPKKLIIPALVLMAVLAVVAVIWRIRSPKPSAPLPPGKPSIAVLPFEDLSPNSDQEYFCDGLADELINRLTKIESMRVPARTSAFSFKGKGLDIREIGDKLKVDTVLEGSVRKSGDRLRITAQLINIADGYPLWSERYDREEKDIFALQDEIALAIVDNLKIEMLGAEKTKLTKRYTDNLEAYNLYLKGQYFWNKRSEQDLKTAIEYFTSSIDKDPKFLNAYVGLAQSYAVLPDYSPVSSKDFYSKAMDAVGRAIELDKTSAEALTSLGLIRRMNWSWEESERDLRKAIELNENYAHAHHWLALSMMFQGRFDEALEEIRLALELDPLSLVINRNHGNILFYARKYDQAMEVLQKTLELDPDFPGTHSLIGSIYLYKSDFAYALSELLKERKIMGNWHPLAEPAIGFAYISMGQRKKALELRDRLLEESNRASVPPACLASLSFVLGENDQGFVWLNKAYEEHDSWLRYLKIYHAYDTIRSDPRYLDILKKIGLDDNRQNK